MNFLLDTNVISELRKGPRSNANVRQWFVEVPTECIYLSTLVFGEIRKGIERVRRRDIKAANVLDGWLKQLKILYSQRLLPVTEEIADMWGSLNVPDPLPTIDGLLAATAIIHDLVLVTRNAKNIEKTGVRFLNPFVTSKPGARN